VCAGWCHDGGWGEGVVVGVAVLVAAPGARPGQDIVVL